jgi:mannosyltransferase OCH1-like enzyme
MQLCAPINVAALLFLTCLVVYSLLSITYNRAFSVDPSLQHHQQEIDSIFALSIKKSSLDTSSKTPVDATHQTFNAPLEDSLAELDSLSPTTCPPGFVRVNDTHIPASHDTTSRKIPKIVFQTSRSRYITPALYKFTQTWRFEGWSYYFYDDDAVMRILREDFPEFPHLRLLTEKCVEYGTMKADLWRYLIVWKYGGLYADLDSVPSSNFTNTTIKVDDDSFFVVENIHLLSQYFMSASPRHPLMYYAIQQSLSNLLTAKDTGELDASLETGPYALHWAFLYFRRDVGAKVKGPKFKHPVREGKFEGTHNRTVTAIGKGGYASNELVSPIREQISRKAKIANYKRMGMTHFHEDRLHPTKHSCFLAIMP